MANEPHCTVVGNLTADPELRFANNGSAWATFTIASTPRTYNRDSGQWEDGDALFMRCSVWRQTAENVAESLRKGHKVIASGTLHQRNWEDNDGNKRTVIEMKVEEIGPALTFVTADIHRADKKDRVPSRDKTPTDLPF